MHYPETTFMGFALGMSECGPMSSLDVNRHNLVMGARSFAVPFTRDMRLHGLSSDFSRRRAPVMLADLNPATALTIKAFAPRTNNRFHVVNYGQRSTGSRGGFSAGVCCGDGRFIGPFQPKTKKELRLAIMSSAMITNNGIGAFDEVVPVDNINSTFI